VNNKIYIFFILLFLFEATDSAANLINNSYSIGLTFKSHEVEKDERTSLSLIPDNPVNFKDGFSLEFDLKLQKTSFGHIFRIILNDSTSLDLFAFIQKGKISFVLNNVHKTSIVSEIDITNDILAGSWAKVSLTVDKQSIKCIINKKTVSIAQSIKDFKIDKIFFGGNKYKAFFTSDVPAMTIKHILLKNKENRIVRNWELAKHGNQVVYDQTDELPSIVENGIWEVDKHVSWKKEIELTIIHPFPQIATDTSSNRVFIATVDSLFVIDLKSQAITKIKTRGGEPFLESSSYLIFNYSTNQLISYNINQPQLITYDFKSDCWSGTPVNRDLSIQHHNRFINTKSNELVLFGGYGKFKYNSTLATHSLDSGDWSFVDFSQKISPRYLATLGNCGNGKFLLFGGFGSESGLQEQGPHNYYDLFQIDINRKTCVRLGAIKEPQKHYNFGNSMIIYGDKFYTLAYRNDLQKSNIRLFEINKNTLDYHIYEDSIPYCFLDRDSYCDLYLWKNTTLYTVILQRDIDSDLYKIKVYSLAFPPLNFTDVLQFPPKVSKGKTVLIIGFSIFLLVVIVLTFFLIKKKRKRTIELVEATGSEVELLSIDESTFAEKSTSVISLLGNFKVVDKNGVDISASFTLIVRQLFVVCILELYTFGSGLTSKQLEDLIWFDMDKSNATNNRNVNISKLRYLLQQIENITIGIDNDSWKINILKGCSCDYVSIISLLNECERQKEINKSKITEIVRIAKAGTLLSNLNYEWLDKYKSHYSYLLIDILMKSSSQQNIASDSKLLVDLSDVLLIHDSIDEGAIQIKCKNLYKQGRKGLSKQCFDKFCAEYKLILNEDTKLKYESIISTPE